MGRNHCYWVNNKTLKGELRDTAGNNGQNDQVWPVGYRTHGNLGRTHMSCSVLAGFQANRAEATPDLAHRLSENQDQLIKQVELQLLPGCAFCR